MGPILICLLIQSCAYTPSSSSPVELDIFTAVRSGVCHNLHAKNAVFSYCVIAMITTNPLKQVMVPWQRSSSCWTRIKELSTAGMNMELLHSCMPQ